LPLCRDTIGLYRPDWYRDIMCGRYTLITSGHELVEVFDLSEEFEWEAQYNIAPSQSVAVVRAGQGGRRLDLLRWGLIPSWAKDQNIGHKLINARSETVAEKPSFRAAFRSRRCLIPADGFYEWKAAGKTKQPIRFTRPDGKPFGMAGLWESWTSPEGEIIETCTVLTTEANDVVGPVHHRMPVILAPPTFEQWLVEGVSDVSSLRPLLRPAPNDLLVATPVSQYVNNARHNDPQCIAPAEAMELPF
jgi:putative SOS response-associated peptidase YedK